MSTLLILLAFAGGPPLAETPRPRLICKRIPIDETLARKRKICLPAEEWRRRSDELQARTRRGIGDWRMQNGPTG